MWFRWLALSLLALLSVTTAAADSGLVASRGELYLRFEDGRTLHGEALRGASLLVGQGGAARRVRIDDVEPVDAVDAPVLLYSLSVEERAGERRSLCRPDALGRRGAIPLTTDDGAIRFTCSSGAEGKCVLLGYPPWGEGSRPMRALHQACIHLIRADYGGDGRPATQDGTLIHVYDRFGIRHLRPGTGMAFEAAWSADGALCVAHARNARLVDLKTLVLRYPRLAGRVGAERCTDALMRRHPEALLFNLSRPTHGAINPPRPSPDTGRGHRLR